MLDTEINSTPLSQLQNTPISSSEPFNPDKFSMYDTMKSHEILLKIDKNFQLERPYQTPYGILYNIKSKSPSDITIDITVSVVNQSEVEYGNDKKLVIQLDLENITLLNTKLFQI